VSIEPFDVEMSAYVEKINAVVRDTTGGNWTWAMVSLLAIMARLLVRIAWNTGQKK
jgi:hypothetical protein